MELESKKDPFTITESVIARIYDIYLMEGIDSPDKYVKIFDILNKASRNDIIRMHINSHGGHVVTGMQMIGAMLKSQGHVITTLEGVAMSLAPLILFAGDEIEISDNSMIMFHDYSKGTYGKGNESTKSLGAWNKLYKTLLNDCASPILTDKEIESIVEGKDHYFTGKQINGRLKKMNKGKK